MYRALITTLVSLAAGLLVACWAQTGGAGGGGQGPAGTPGPEPTVPPEGRPAVDAAKKDLAGRTGKPAEQLSVVSVEPVEWRDTSLGCPEPGKFYAQVITPGYRIILSDGAHQYEYHSDTGGRTVRCDGGR